MGWNAFVFVQAEEVQVWKAAHAEQSADRSTLAQVLSAACKRLELFVYVDAAVGGARPFSLSLCDSACKRDGIR